MSITEPRLPAAEVICRTISKWIVPHFDANNIVGHELRNWGEG
jgi:hypothetical protein